MNVFCPNCNTLYRVDPAKVPENGVRARCAVCSAVFAVRPEAGRPLVSAAAPPPEPPPPPPPPPSIVERPVFASPAPGAPAAGRAGAPAGPAMPGRGSAMPPPAMRPGSGARPGPAVRPAPPAFRPAGPAMPPSADPAPTAGSSVASAGAAPVEPAPAPLDAAPAVSAPEPAAAAPPPTPVPAAQPQPAPTPSARPINPFLSQDPAAKARRLARALISDMVVYHPAKRQEGLREGTLKDLFDEEIRKSWEEYSEQVGKEVAESTSYFKEALNEILADGRQIF